MPHVLILGRIHERGVAVLRAHAGVTFDMVEDVATADLAPRLPEADGILVRTSKLSAEMIAAAPKLRIVARHGVGYDNVAVDALNARRIPLAITTHANAGTAAEHVMFFLLALAKRGVAYDRAVREGRWGARNEGGTVDLAGRRLLLLGFGRIGRAVAERANAFGMRVCAYDPYVDAATLDAAGVDPVADWRAALSEADAVSVHLPRTQETVGLLSAPEFRRMKASAWVINAARGGIVDEAALAAAIEAGDIAGAGVDVFDAEPPAADHPLFGLDRVVVSPHIAGVTAESLMRMAVEAAENVLAAFDGRLDPGVVVNRAALS